MFSMRKRHLSSLEDFDFGEFITKSEIEEKRPRSKNDIVELLSTGRGSLVSMVGVASGDTVG